MTVFWIVAALFLVAALLLVLPSLLSPRAGSASVQGANLAVHRDQLLEAERDLSAGLIGQERMAQLRDEIQHRVLEDAQAPELAAPLPARRTAWVLALLIPVASVLTYLQLGSPQAAAPQISAAPAGRHSVTTEQIQQMVTALAERLKAEPNDLEGWLMLGRSYTVLERYRDAATAFRRAVDLGPPSAGLLADLADVTGMAQGKRLAGEPARLIQKALDVDPRHVKALALAGSVAFEAKDYAGARAYWQRLLAVVPPESPMAASVKGSIAEASQLEAGSPAPSPAAKTAGAVSGQVSISPALAAQVTPGATLFVFARAQEGPRMPLAILRRPVDGHSLDFTLDDSMAMTPELRLSGFGKLVIGARISKTGNATPQAGDLIGQSEPVAPGASGLRVVINQVQP